MIVQISQQMIVQISLLFKILILSMKIILLRIYSKLTLCVQ